MEGRAGVSFSFQRPCAFFDPLRQGDDRCPPRGGEFENRGAKGGGAPREELVHFLLGQQLGPVRARVIGVLLPRGTEVVGDALCKPSDRPGPGHPASGHPRTQGLHHILAIHTYIYVRVYSIITSIVTIIINRVCIELIVNVLA